MRTKLPEKITTMREAEEFLFLLHMNSEAFHPEDDANDLVGDPFTKEEGDKLNELMSQINEIHNFDPCEYLLSIQYDTVIQHGELYAMGIDLSKRGNFRWSSNVSEAWRLTKEDTVWFIKAKRKNKWPYELERAEKK